MLKFERYWGRWIINTYLEYPSFPSRPTWCTRSPASSRCGQQYDPSCVRGGQTNDWLIDWLIDWILFFVSFENTSLKYRHQHRQWRDAKFKPRLGAYGFWAVRDFYRSIVATCMTSFLRLDSLIPKDHPVLPSFTTSQGFWEPILNRIPKVYLSMTWTSRYMTKKKKETVGVAHWVRALAPQAEGCSSPSRDRPSRKKQVMIAPPPSER